MQSAQAMQTPQAYTETFTDSQTQPVKVVAEDPSKYYIVKEGDTIYNISHRFNINMRQLNVWNNLDSDSGIKKGMKLKIRE
jgi:LysM repeat protein